MPVKKTKTTKKSSVAQTPKKRFHHHHFPMIPLGSWILFWFFVLLTILFSTACFTNVLDTTGRYTTSTATNGSLATRLALEAKVAELQKQVTTTTTQEAPCVSNDLIVDETHLTYQDLQFGVRMTLPYSSYEDSSGCVLSSTVKQSDGAIAFGPFVGVGGGSDQDSYIKILAVTSTSVILKDLKAQASNTENPVSAIRQSTVNGLTVISHKETWAIGGGAKYWYAIGRNFSYEIGSLGWLTDAEAIKIIQSLKVVK